MGITDSISVSKITTIILTAVVGITDTIVTTLIKQILISKAYIIGSYKTTINILGKYHYFTIIGNYIKKLFTRGKVDSWT